MASSRTTNFTVAEDRHLCGVYLEVSQDLIVGKNQSKKRFWERICDRYHESKTNSNMPNRSERSLQTRIRVIIKDCIKFLGCLTQVEALNISGANEQILLDRANDKMRDNDDYPNNFKFDHVWPMMKNFLQVETTRHEESTLGSSNPSQSSFSTFSRDDDNMNNEDSLSQRPYGVKKSKLKKKQNEDAASFEKMLKEENERLRELIAKSQAQRAKDALFKKTKHELKKTMREDNILMLNLDMIVEPDRREYFRSQQQILQKWKEAEQANSSSFTMFGNFPDLGGSGSGLSDY
ncbi:hypothetical protein C2S51_012739 [Perilla frutescens var. frutescens]|nr:hypothetical protein C2S51_012739 [Perilla frutescens var. frutescens]